MLFIIVNSYKLRSKLFYKQSSKTVLRLKIKEKQKKKKEGSLFECGLVSFVTVSRFQNWHEKNLISTTARVHQVTTTVTVKRLKFYKKKVDRKNRFRLKVFEVQCPKKESLIRVFWFFLHKKRVSVEKFTG